MRFSKALLRALDADVVDQNVRLRALLDNGELSEAEACMARKVVKCNDEELNDPVMGAYHRGSVSKALTELSNTHDHEIKRYRAYRLAIATSFVGDWKTLRDMRTRGVRISTLRGRHGLAAGYAVDYPACLAEFLDDGMDPNATWQIGDKTTDLLTRAAEVNGRPDVIRMILGRGGKCTSRALVGALEHGHDDAAHEIIKRDPTVAVPKESQTRWVLASLYRVHSRIIKEMRLEMEDMARARDDTQKEHERFLNVEFPSLLTSAIGLYSLENTRLRVALQTV